VALPESLALIDLETTGANPLTDRITEIAVLRVERGEIVARWQTLVNPLCPIPPLIQRLVGIDDDMVASAPPFALIAPKVREILAGAVFVAHNARFDYGFLRNEFARIGEAFDASVLCTVKLSRALYPDHHRHGLDALIARHAFTCTARHRAMGDAEVLWQFACLVNAGFPADVLAAACERAMKAPARPAGLPEGVLEGLPDGPGVYFLHGEGELPLYIGHGASLRARVVEQLTASGRKGKDAELAAKVRRITWQETAGDLAAQLLEARLVGERRPLHNRMPTAPEEVFGLRLLAGRKRPPVLDRVRIGGTDPAGWEGVHGSFRARKEADNLLRELARAYQLCPRRLGLEAGANGACSAWAVKRCAGVCAGKESFAAHDARLVGALGAVTLRAWPWPGAVVVAERSPHAELSAFHLLDRWCHLGSADSREGLEALLANAPARSFDLDIYRILTRWLAVPEHLAMVMPVAE
jgi:DNA polymerase-3 subunit epsilon